MSVARLDPKYSAVLLIDMQAQLVPVMQQQSTLIRRTGRLVEGARVLEMPVAVTEQSPRSMGRTYGAISSKLSGAIYTDPKLRFSACSESLNRFLENFEVKSVVVAGVEAHVCVLLTCLELVERGFTVAVCIDALGSRREVDKKAAVERMIQAGVLPTTVEAVLFELLGDANSPKFRELRSVIQSDE